MAAERASGTELPKPILQLLFEDDFANSGTAAGTATVSVYAQGEGPYLMPGPWGSCLDLSAASRLGGGADDEDPAGGAAFFTHDALDSLRDFTLAFWACGSKDAQGINSRVFTKFGSWELLYARGSMLFTAVRDKYKPGYRFPRSMRGRAGQWTFVAVSVGQTGRKILLTWGDRDAGLAEPCVHELTLAPTSRKSALEIGNFRGIRPFKGRVDNVRIYAEALSQEQLQRLFEQDAAAWANAKPELVYGAGVTPRPKRAFQFKRSDIPFSSRWQSRKAEETFALLREYHATHLLWVYGSGPEYIRKVHDLGVQYQGTLNSLVGYRHATQDPSAQRDTSGRQWDFDCHKFVHPHMVKWRMKFPLWVGCHNNADFRRLYQAEVKQLVEAGADAIHVDGWEMAAASAARGQGCFCPGCMAWFRAYLERHVPPDALPELGVEDVDTFDYRAHLNAKCGIADAKAYRAKFRDLPLTKHFLRAQRLGLRDFYLTLRHYLDSLSPNKYIPVSVNNQFCRRTSAGGLRAYYCADVLDFFVGEGSQSMQSANHFVHACKLAEAFGIPQVMMSKPRAVAASQAALAASYALGALFRVPWDLYMDNDAAGQPAARYYGRREDWGAFYDFIHENASLFDGYESAAAAAVLVNADTDCWRAVWEECERLSRAQVPFRVVAAAAECSRLPVDPAALYAVRHVVLLSPLESFCDQDRRSIEAVRASRRVRFLTPQDHVVQELKQAGRALVELEGPENVYAFMRVKPQADARSAVVHIVNWNPRPDGRAADPFAHVTVRLLRPPRWGEGLKAKYYAPGRKRAVDVQPEVHRDYVRITLPRLDAWGVLELRPGR